MHHPTILQKFSPSTTARSRRQHITNTNSDSSDNTQNTQVQASNHHGHPNHPGIRQSRRQSTTTPISHHETLPTTQIFPFSAHHALTTCLHSATTITASLFHIYSLGTRAAPPICSAALASCTLMMIFHFEHQLPQSQSQSHLSLRLQSRSRLETRTMSPFGTMQGSVQAQCEESTGTAIQVLESFAGGFEFIGGLRDQIKKAAHATFCSRPSQC
jgi:hypothetical protein